MESLKNIREEKQISQKLVAEKIGCAVSTYANWEQGRCEPSIQDLKKLADYFACTIDYLVGREDELGNVTVGSDALSDSELTLVELFRAMPEARRRTVLDMMQALSENVDSTKTKKFI